MKTSYTLLLFLYTLTGWLFLGVGAGDIVYVTVETTVQAATTVIVTPTVPSPASYTAVADFEDTVLQVSNDYREAHEADALVWNETLTKYARNWAETCIWKHSVSITRGRSIYTYPFRDLSL